MIFCRFHCKISNSRIIENSFHSYSPTRYMGYRNCHDTHDRRHYISKTMLPQDLSFEKSLGSSKKYIILPHLIQEFVTYHICVIPEMAEDHYYQRKDHMLHTIADTICHSYIIGTAAWEPSKIYTEDQDQYHTKPESRHIIGCCSDLADQPVDPLILMERTEYGDQNCQYKDHNISDSSQHQSISDQRFDHIHNRLPVFQRQSEITMDCIGKPPYILYPDPLIQSQSCSGRSHFLAGHHFQRISVKGLQGISRRQSRQPEHHHRQQKHNHYKQKDPFQDPDDQFIFFVHNFPFPFPFTYM